MVVEYKNDLRVAIKINRNVMKRKTSWQKLIISKKIRTVFKAALILMTKEFPFYFKKQRFNGLAVLIINVTFW